MTTRARYGLLGGLVLLIGSLLFYAQPYWTSHRLQQAILKQDPQQIANLIDQTALTNSLRTQLMTSMDRHIPAQGDEIDALGRLLTQRMIEQTASYVTTPEGLYSITVVEPTENKTTSAPAIQVQSQGYQSFNQFGMTITNPSAATLPLHLQLTRQGLGWRLTQLILPKAEATQN